MALRTARGLDARAAAASVRPGHTIAAGSSLPTGARPLRVLQVMECTIGGTRRHLRDLVHGLLALGVDVEVACSARREPRVRADMDAMRAAGARVHEVAMVRRITPLRDAWDAARLATLVCDRRIDVLHTHSSKAGALGRMAGLLVSGARRVHTPHTFAAAFDGAGQGGEAPGPRALLLATERILGRATAAMVHVSESERLEGRELGVVPPARAHVIPNGIDAVPFAGVPPPGGPRGAAGEALRAGLGLPPDALVLGSVGLLNDAKGHDLLVEAAARLPARVHVLLVGHGEREPALREQARALGLAERVHLLGWRDDLPACYDAMDVFALPSRWEGLPYVLLEAMAAARPCVATDVNGSRDILGHAPRRVGPLRLAAAPGGGTEPEVGLLVPAGDAAALADAVATLADDAPRRARLGAAARAHVAARFSVDAMVGATLALYRRVCGAS